MNINKYYALIFILLLSLVFESCTKKPDSLYINGKIYSLDNNNTVYEAAAISEGKILEMGSTKELSDKYKSDNIVDLKGATVIPGLIDCEASLIEFSKNLNFINLAQARSIADIKRMVSEKVKNAKSGDWIGGYGWNPSLFTEAEQEKLDRKVLDEAAPNNNVYILDITGTTVWVNSKLLQTAGITKNTQITGNGEIEMDESGEMTGIFYDDAQSIIKEKVPEITKDDYNSMIEKGTGELLKYGITEIHDRSVSVEGLNIIKELIDKNKFPVKLYAVLSSEDKAIDEYIKKGIEEDYKGHLTVRSISIDYDGAFEDQDAAMKNDFLQEPKRKIPYSDEFVIEGAMRKAVDKNFQFCVKAIGDRALNASLKVIEKIVKEKNLTDHRTIIDQIEFTDLQDINKLKELKVIPVITPETNLYDIINSPALIGIEESRKAGLWNTLLKTTGYLAAGSDFPYHQINPFLQMYYLSTRQIIDTGKTVIANPDQKLSVIEALRCFTTYAAYSGFEEKKKGSLEKGKSADMVVLSEDILSGDPKKLLNVKVLKTIIDGKIVFEDSKSISSAAK
ncbi:amidohydrolase [soil metagenome]